MFIISANLSIFQASSLLFLKTKVHSTSHSDKLLCYVHHEPCSNQHSFILSVSMEALTKMFTILPTNTKTQDSDFMFEWVTEKTMVEH